ncbi:MAG TPA: S8 family serine peptidase [Longimicrobium sp.]|nr:S8 family serine peptidase [Longimicrobium sp.]
MRQPQRPFRLVPLVLAAAVLAACDQRTPDLPTGARAEAGQAGVAPLLTAGTEAIPGRYVVVMRGGQAGTAADVARGVAATHGARVSHTYSAALNGFAAELSPRAVEALRRNPQVEYVAEDGMAYPGQVTQPMATWGLDRIDQRALPLNTTYVYGRTGSGVRVYVIDTGIRTTHNEFGGRASVGADFVNDGQNGQDCNGHGTHVAGTVAGATYGVAKAANVISVRVFGCSGGAAWSTIIAAVDWVTANAVKPAVANMSLGGGYYAPVNTAVANSIASGVTYAIAAGNDNWDACSYSPASTPAAITVGSTDSNDARSWFSNYGTCVDLFGPGGSITSAWWNSNTAVHTISGTSMATPHVAGVAALYLQGSPTATPATVHAAVLATSTTGRLTSIGPGSPNRLLFSLLTVPPPPSPILLNPATLSFTFVRPVPSAVAAPAGAAAPVFTATPGGPAKPGPNATPAGEEATLSTTLSRSAVMSHSSAAALNWTARSNRAWLTADPTDGRLNPGHDAIVTANVNSAALAAGTHTGTVTITDPAMANATSELGVTVSIIEPLLLTIGTPRTGISGAQGSERFYAVHVPLNAASLRIATTGGTGDADLYVRYGALPSTGTYDCVSAGGTNEDACQSSAPVPGTYYVMVRGYLSYSGLSIGATTGGPPSAPSNLNTRPASLTSILVTWADGSVNETGFVVSRRAAPSGIFGPWADVGSPGRNGTNFTSAGLAAGVPYQFRVRACNAAGCSAWAAGATVTIPTSPPAAPFNLVANPASGTVAALTWSDGSADETSFSLARALRNLDGTWGAYTTIVSLPTDATAFNNAGLLSGRQYRYQLRACNPSGCSALATSNIVVMPSVPPAPPAIAATALAGRSIRVQWTDAATNERSVTLQRAPVSSGGFVGNFALVASLAPNTVAYTNTGLSVGTYQYRVRACNQAGCSAWTTSGNVTIPPVPGAPASVSGVPLSTTSVRVTWPDAGAVETSYQVYGARRNLDGTWPAYSAITTTLPANTVLYNHAGLLSGRAYRYQVRACNVTGCSAFATSNIVSTP